MVHNCPSEIIKEVTPLALTQYLTASGWEGADNSRDPLGIYWRPESRLTEILIPKKPEYGDYKNLMKDAILVLAKYEGRDIEDIISEITTLIPSDAIKIRVSGTSIHSGTIPLIDGVKLYNGMKKVLLTSAYSTQSPSKYFPYITQNTNDKEIANFINNCKLGQTKIGSYIVRCYCPLTGVVSNKQTHLSTPDNSFTRKVLTNLMISMNQIENAVESKKFDDIINPDSKSLVSANLCEAILEMEPSVDNTKLDVSVMWASKQPKDVPSTVVIEKEDFQVIGELSQLLRPKEDGEEKPYFGQVYCLNKGAKRGKSKVGTVSIDVVRGDSIVSAKVKLTGENHQKACKAYETGATVKIRGLLQRKGRVFSFSKVTEFEIQN